MEDEQVNTVRRRLTASPPQVGSGYCTNCGKQHYLVRIVGYNPMNGQPNHVSACVNTDCCIGGGHKLAPLSAVQLFMCRIFGDPSRRCTRCGAWTYADDRTVVLTPHKNGGYDRHTRYEPRRDDE